MTSRGPTTSRFQGKFMTCVKAPGGRPFYYASFCDCNPRAQRFFAAVCGNHVTVCELRRDGHIDFRQVYADEDSEEQFYTCAWTLAPKLDDSFPLQQNDKDESNLAQNDSIDDEATKTDQIKATEDDITSLEKRSSPADKISERLKNAEKKSVPDSPGQMKSNDQPEDAVLLIVAGFRGIIKLIDCRTCTLVGSLIGHGNHVNEVRVHTKNPELLFSASRDESLRLWNLKTRTCVAIFAGDQGHRDQVLSVDVHYLGSSMVSASMDNTIKIWDLDTVKIRNAIENSHSPPTESSVAPFKTTFLHFPSFSTRRVHTDYVDCVRWVGDLLLSKSTDNTIVLWRPVRNGTDSADAMILREYCMRGAEVCWFVRFGITKQMHQLVCGR